MCKVPAQVTDIIGEIITLTNTGCTCLVEESHIIFWPWSGIQTSLLHSELKAYLCKLILLVTAATAMRYIVYGTT